MAAVVGAEGLVRVARSADVRPGQRGRVKEILGDARVDVLGGVAGAGPAAAVDAVADHLQDALARVGRVEGDAADAGLEEAAVVAAGAFGVDFAG